MFGVLILVLLTGAYFSYEIFAESKVDRRSVAAERCGKGAGLVPLSDCGLKATTLVRAAIGAGRGSMPGGKRSHAKDLDRDCSICH